MRIGTAKQLMAAACMAAGLLAGSHALAADEAAAKDEQPQTQEAKPAPSEAQPKRTRGRRMTEISKCKQEARGMRGPDRGSFMTECLGSDRNEK